MFTGIVRETGTVRIAGKTGAATFRIGCARPAETIEIGASICCNGVCLTVTAVGADEDGSWFEADVSVETFSRTTLGTWIEGAKVNLEPSLRVGDEMGGHIVSGHVDGVGEIVGVRPEGGNRRVSIRTTRALGRFIAPKGSITLDGISLTVNEVADAGDATTFGVNVIPHTWAVTSLSDAVEGGRVNLETDILARYVQRLAEAG